MTGFHNLKPLRSHARTGLRSRLADWFRRDDEPEMLPAPVMDLHHDDGLDVADAVRALLEQDEPGWDLAAPAMMQAHPPWNTAEQPVLVPDGADYGYRGQTLTDPRSPEPRPYAADRMSPLRAPVEADLDALPLFRATVHAEIVRRERPRAAADIAWLPGYARLWHQRAAATQKAATAPLPDFGLHRHDGIVDDLVTRAVATADAGWAADRAAAAAMATCPEYAGRHSTADAAEQRRQGEAEEELAS